MRLFISTLPLILPTLALAIPGVDVVAGNDTVMKVIYSGGSPSTTHPNVVVKGKKIGIHSEANNVSGSRGVVGLAGGASDGGGGTSIGVVGSSSHIGVLGEGGSNGQGVKGTTGGYFPAVEGVGYNIGVQGSGGAAGVYGIGDIGVSGSGTSVGINGTSPDVGVKGIATNGAGGRRGVVGLSGGVSDPGTSAKIGVMGASSQIGVLGDGGSTGPGVKGVSGGYGAGIEGTGYYSGVYGVGGSVGVEGTGSYYGVAGNSLQEYGIGVYGYAVETGAHAGYFDGDVYATGDISWGSDAGLKQNVRALDKGLKTVMALQPRAYEMKPGISNSKATGTKFGLIAQDVRSVLPEIVKSAKTPPKKNSNGKLQEPSERQEYLALNYVALIPVLIKAIQEQQQKIEQLEARLQGR